MVLIFRPFLAYPATQQFLDFQAFLVVPIIKHFTIQIIILIYAAFHKMCTTKYHTFGPLIPLGPAVPALPGSPGSPTSPGGPFIPLLPRLPSGPIGPDGPGRPRGPSDPGKPLNCDKSWM